MTPHPLLERLTLARQQGALLADVPAEHLPTTLDEAYAIADALAPHLGEEVAGWKVGASVERSWQRLGLGEPFGGRIFTPTVHEHPAAVEGVPDTLTIGAEFALRIGRDLRTDETGFDAESIKPAIDAVYPVLELNRPSYANPMEIGGLALIADNGVNYGLVVGTPLPDWPQAALDAQTVTLFLNSEEQSSGAASAIGFDPYAAVAWLANDRAQRGDPLRAGQLISAGDLIGPVEADPGDEVSADFGPYGIVTVTLKQGP